MSVSIITFLGRCNKELINFSVRRSFDCFTFNDTSDINYNVAWICTFKDYRLQFFVFIIIDNRVILFLKKNILEIRQRLSRRFSFPHIKDISMQEIVRHKNWTKIHKTTENVE